MLATVLDRLFSMGIPVGEKIVRTLVVYLVLLLLLRFGGMRTAAQLKSFDLVVLLLVSNVVQNAIIGPDDSLVGGMLGALVLIAANDGLVRVVRKNNAIDRVLEGRRIPLLERGSYLDGQLRRLGMRESDLDVALRRQGVDNIAGVERAELAPSGAIVVTLQPEARGASLGEIERLERKLDELRASVDRLAPAGS